MNRSAILALLTLGALLVIPTTAAARYVDGMNLYRAYFAPMGADPSGNEWIKKSETKYMATSDEDSLMSLAWEITGDKSDWQHYPHAKSCAVADVSNLLTPAPRSTMYAAIVIQNLTGSDFDDQKTLAGGPEDFAEMYRQAFGTKIPVRHPYLIVDDIMKTSGEGATPIRELFVAGHGSETKGSICAYWPGQNGSRTLFHFRPAKDLLTISKAPTLERAMARKGPCRCWFTRDARAYLLGCNSGPAVAEPFANQILRKGSKATGAVGLAYPHYGGTYNQSAEGASPFTSPGLKSYPGKR